MDLKLITANDILKIKSETIRKMLLDKLADKMNYKQLVKCIEAILRDKDDLGSEFKLYAKKDEDNDVALLVLKYYKNFKSVEYLRYLGGFKTLDLTGTSITSLDKLPGKIRKLMIVNTKISDLKPLMKIPLVDLDIGNTNVKDISPLFNMTSLKLLRTSNNQISQKQAAKLPKGVKIYGWLKRD